MPVCPFNFCIIVRATHIPHMEVTYVVDDIICEFHSGRVNGRHYEILIIEGGTSLLG